MPDETSIEDLGFGAVRRNFVLSSLFLMIVSAWRKQLTEIRILDCPVDIPPALLTTVSILLFAYFWYRYWCYMNDRKRSHPEHTWDDYLKRKAVKYLVPMVLERNNEK